MSDSERITVALPEAPAAPSLFWTLLRSRTFWGAVLLIVLSLVGDFQPEIVARYPHLALGIAKVYGTLWIVVRILTNNPISIAPFQTPRSPTP